MKTEDIEYNGQIFSCRKIIDISSMIELLSLLAKKQQLLEDKLNFQEERINDKDKRISELEIMIKGVSLSKEEKFIPEKAIPSKKEEIKNDFDDDLDAFLKDDKKDENKNINQNEIKEEQEVKKDEVNINEEKPEEKIEEKVEKKPVEKKEEKKEERYEEKKEEKKEEKYEEKKEEKKEEKYEEKKEVKDDDIDDKKKEEVIENQININFEQKQTPNFIMKENLAQTENNQIPVSKNPEIKENANNVNDIDTNQNRSIPQESTQNSQNEEILKKIIKRIKLLESKIDTFQQKDFAAKALSVATDKANKSKLENRINLLNNKIEQLQDDQNKMKEEMAKIKEKAEDFNVYDLIKGNSDDGNIDVAKGLVMNLENKIYKKFGLYDSKLKKDEEDIYQNKNDFKNINNLINSLKESLNKNNKDIEELKNNNIEKYEEINKYISEINNKIKDINNKINLQNRNNNINEDKDKIDNKEQKDNQPITNNINDNIDNEELTEKIKELESKIEKINENIESLKEHHDEIKDNISKEENSLSQETLKFMKDIASRTSELEKHMKLILTQLNIKEVNERLDSLEKDMNKKCNKFEISELKEKLLTLEENEKDLNFKMDQMQQFIEKIRGDMQNFIKKIESLSGQINRISSDGGDNDKGKGPIIDINKFVDMNSFNEKNKEINKKFDKIRLSFEEVARNMDDIFLKLSHVPTDKDFSQFQTVIRTMIDDLKLSLNKKYAERTETSKSIKFLETQIKAIQESFQKKAEGADNWLLAKKPLNNYVCASCESIIKGELKKNSEFVPWNKYPNREEKSYRYGHGFSRMLQLINEDKKRELKEKDNLSDGGSDSESKYKLPNIKRLHINSGKLKNNNIYNIMSDDEINLPFDKHVGYKNELDPILTEERPKIMKIIKRNKNVTNSSYLNRMNEKERMASLIAKTQPNEVKEENQNEQNELNVITNKE